jgi:hypothetical protein
MIIKEKQIYNGKFNIDKNIQTIYDEVIKEINNIDQIPDKITEIYVFRKLERLNCCLDLIILNNNFM